MILLNMGGTLEFDSFEKQFLDIIAEFQTLSSSEKSLREAVRAECSRAETAEAAREAAERSAEEAQAGAAAATAGATHAAAALARLQEQFTATNLQQEITDRQRVLLEERCSELSTQVSSLEREVQQLQPFQASHQGLQRQYQELLERVRAATEDARNEASRVESEVRRVEKCASGGEQVRSRARLAAAAHARDRTLAAEQINTLRKELANANGEIARLNIIIAGYQRQSEEQGFTTRERENYKSGTEDEYVTELRSALAAERAGAARLERALNSAMEDCAALAARIPTERPEETAEEHHHETEISPASVNTNITAIDSFLAE